MAGNLKKHLERVREAKAAGAEVVLFPELSIVGYPPKDLLLKPSLLGLCADAELQIAQACEGITAIVGTIEKNTAKTGRPVHNSVAVLRDGKVIARRKKSLLPTYDVFDESRYFEPGKDTEITQINGRPIGVSICEDLWNDEKFVERPLYHFNPIGALAEAGASMLFNISASPFVLGKNEYRHQLFGFQAKRWNMPIVYVNQVGGNDELVFDGNSVVFNAQGEVIAQGRDFEEDLVLADLGDGKTSKPDAFNTRHHLPRGGIASIHAALVLGLKDYVAKCGFKSVVLGLSGGIDSAVVAALAVDALGSQNVMGVSLPSRYSSDHSKSDAVVLAERLNIRFETVPIEAPHRGMEEALAPLFAGTKEGLAEENIQARLRGNILMALSNKFGHMLLTTGNKSEVAVGYCTLYGDMCGGLAVISDVPKMMVYELARYINSEWEKAGKAPPIPEGTLTKPPSAELKPGQKDQDSLPPYDILDAIIELSVEDEKSASEIIAAGYDAATVNRIIRLIDISEYKRKQMAPGIKVTSRAFGFGRRMPIAQGFNPNLTTLREPTPPNTNP
jgi:NAD+ synthetase